MARYSIVTAGLLGLALVPIVSAVSPETSTPPSRVPVAIAQPLAAMSTGPMITVEPAASRRTPLLPESGMLVLVGTGLLGLAALVRRSTRT